MAARKQIDDRRILGLYKLYGAKDGVGKRVAAAVGCSRNNVTRVLRKHGWRIYPGKGETSWQL